MSSKASSRASHIINASIRGGLVAGACWASAACDNDFPNCERSGACTQPDGGSGVDAGRGGAGGDLHDDAATPLVHPDDDVTPAGGRGAPPDGGSILEQDAACFDGGCLAPACGDGRTQSALGESCDDGNSVDTDGCPSTCREAFCGDGFVYEGVEACDDGNDIDSDGCLGTCELASCGDGIVHEGEEQCEGALTDSCTFECRWAWMPRDFCAVQRVTGMVKCWGHNTSGRLGHEVTTGTNASAGDEPGEMGANLQPVDLGSRAKALAVSGLNRHACALLEGGTIKCWGSNDSGQLGLAHDQEAIYAPGDMGDNLPAVALGAGRAARSVSAGGLTTCALLDDRSVKCWGYNVNGQLGQGDNVFRGDGPGEMGDNLPIVELGTGRKTKAVRVGGLHVCALLDDSRLKCWGSNSRGELGLGNTATTGDQEGEMGDDLPYVDLGTDRTVSRFWIGWHHTCALLDDGAFKCWGDNGSGQLGLGDRGNRGDRPDEMGDALPAIDVGTGEQVIWAALGRSHTCVLLESGAVKCWGDNGSGQLGLGSDTPAVGDGPGQMGDDLPAVDLGPDKAVAITARIYSTCALLESGAVKCWGRNRDGELGLGDHIDRGLEPGDMGENLPPVDLD